MEDDEIDRIFRDATKGYESAASSTVSSPPESVENNVNADKDETGEENSEHWQYALPSPPRAFRDQTDDSRTVEDETTTSNSLMVTFNEEQRLTKEAARSTLVPSSVERPCVNQNVNETASAVRWESKYQPSTQDSGVGSDDSIPSVSDNKPVFKAIKPSSVERRASTLQNFTISTYQNSKPTEIFHDESVKTWKTTELAKNNRPFASKPVLTEKSPSGNHLGRHCSFHAVDRTPNSLIKRSKSHISLLSGNFAKFNRFGKLDVKSEDSYEPDGSSELDPWKANKLRSQSLPSTNSGLVEMCGDRTETAIRNGNKKEENLLQPRDLVRLASRTEEKSSIICDDGSVSQLQSLQILKNILPQIDRTHYQRGHAASSFDSCERDHQICEPRSIDLGTKSSPQIPSVNLQSWSDRPRRQVSIKTDRDYVFGGGVCNASSVSSDESAYGSVVDSLSRVPVVTAVEFKKPLTPARVIDNENEQPALKSTIVVLNDARAAAKKSTNGSAPHLPWSANNYVKGETTRNGRVTGFTFKEYKNKLASKEKSTCAITNNAVTNNENRSTINYKNERVYGVIDDSVCKMRKNGTGFNDSRNVDRPHDRAATRQIGGRTFVTVPPAPPAMPMLKPVSRDFDAIRSCSATNLDPRDLLLSSIKNFNRDNLRKLRVK